MLENLIIIQEPHENIRPAIVEFMEQSGATRYYVGIAIKNEYIVTFEKSDIIRVALTLKFNTREL